jgi:hypothetical protein
LQSTEHFSVSRTNSVDQIEKNEMGVACSRYGGEQRRIQGFGKKKPEGKRSLVRPRRRWEDNVKMDFLEVGCGSMD